MRLQIPVMLVLAAVAADAHAEANELMASFERGEAQAAAIRLAAPPAEAAPAPAPRAGDYAALVPENEDLGKLVDEIHSLRSKVAAVRRNSLSTQHPADRKQAGSKVFFNFQEGALYEVHAGIDRVTDIELSPDEALSNSPVAGDTVRWKIAIVKSGTEQGEITHVLVKPIEEGIETNVILTTTKRTYHLQMRSSDWYMPAVAWNYPDGDLKNIERELARKQAEEPLAVKAADLSFDYDIDGRDYDWKPIRVFDDGTHTYLQMPAGVQADEAPAFFAIDEEGEPMLANYRVKGAYYIVDRLFERAELRIGKRKVVKITNTRRHHRGVWERLF